jgi:hypothetical protein
MFILSPRYLPALLATALALLSACGPTLENGSAETRGILEGQAFEATNALFVPSMPLEHSVSYWFNLHRVLPGEAATLFLSGDARACQALDERSIPGGSTLLLALFSVDDRGRATAALSAGEYAILPVTSETQHQGRIPAGRYALAVALERAFADDAHCRGSFVWEPSVYQPVAGFSSGGTVTLLEAESERLSARFELLFPDESTPTTGNFDAAFCSALARGC